MMQLIDAWENMNFLISEISSSAELLEMLTDIALHSEHPKSWRAAWLLDKIHDNNKEAILPYINLFIEKLKSERNEGKKRHLLKLVSINRIPEDQQGFLLEFCIRIFSSQKEAIAVRVHAMQVLYEISNAEPELKPEILAIIEQVLAENTSAGLKSRGSKIECRLRKQIARN